MTIKKSQFPRKMVDGPKSGKKKKKKNDFCTETDVLPIDNSPFVSAQAFAPPNSTLVYQVLAPEIVWDFS